MAMKWSRRQRVRTSSCSRPGFTTCSRCNFAFDPLFAVNTSGAIGGAIPWLVNTHGARLFSITLSPSAPPVAAGVPEPATVALVLIAFAGLFTARRYRKPAPARDAR